jgi:hypothetical protein
MLLLSAILLFQLLNERIPIACGFGTGTIQHVRRQSWSAGRSEKVYKPTTLSESTFVNDGVKGTPKNITKTKIADRTTNHYEFYSNSSSLLSESTFNLYCRIHCTLTILRKYFPTLLDLPPVPISIAEQWIYDSNVTISGPKGEELAVGVDEVLGVTRALAVVTTAAKRAGSFLDMTMAGNRGSASRSISISQVECELMMDGNNPFQALVLWRTQLPQPSLTGNDRQYTEIAGRSVFELSRQSGRITSLQIQKVQINGVTINESLGTALASIRSTARSSPLFESLSGTVSKSVSSGSNPLLDGILSGLRDVVDALPSSSDDATTIEDCQLNILPQASWSHASFLEGSNDANVSYPVQIDTYARSEQFPVLGSESFVEYALLHKSLVSLEKKGLYKLAGNSTENDVAGGDIRSFFSSNVKLVKSTSSRGKTNDDRYITLLKGAGNVADLYRSLALFRQTSGGDWSVRLTENNWREGSLTVSWESKSPLSIEGSDKFFMEKPWLATSYSRLPLINDGDIDEIAKRCSDYFGTEDTSYNTSPLTIERIENVNLTIGGVPADSEWANSFIVAARNTPIPDPTISELLRTLATRQSTPKKTPSVKKDQTESIMPLLDDSAAASFYQILRSLHIDLSNIGNQEIKSSTPAGDFLSEDIELRGLLRERLVSGSQGYNRLIGVSISSLRAAIQTGRVRLAAPPRPIIEVTAKGSIKVDFLLALWIDAPSFGSPSGGFGVPLKIQLVSEYIIDRSGKIREHVILESRLNGVLTPGDVFSRWINGLSSDDDALTRESNDMPAALEQLVGALNWVKNMQSRNNKK